jgi:hypothetical protein
VRERHSTRAQWGGMKHGSVNARAVSVRLLFLLVRSFTYPCFHQHIPSFFLLSHVVHSLFFILFSRVHNEARSERAIKMRNGSPEHGARGQSEVCGRDVSLTVGSRRSRGPRRRHGRRRARRGTRAPWPLNPLDTCSSAGGNHGSTPGHIFKKRWKCVRLTSNATVRREKKSEWCMPLFKHSNKTIKHVGASPFHF